MEAAGSSEYSVLHPLLACVLFPQSLWIIILEIKKIAVLITKWYAHLKRIK
jgi:hypothetical protein